MQYIFLFRSNSSLDTFSFLILIINPTFHQFFLPTLLLSPQEIAFKELDATRYQKSYKMIMHALVPLNFHLFSSKILVFLFQLLSVLHDNGLYLKLQDLHISFFELINWKNEEQGFFTEISYVSLINYFDFLML